MADIYKRHGVDVIRQYVTSFREVLANEGVQYTDLTIKPSVDVVTYFHGGEKRYALIKPLSMPDDYTELVYITSQTPDDCDWDKLASDVEAQHKGAAPEQRRTRAKMLLDAAAAAYGEQASVEDIFAVPVSSDDDLIQAIEIYLASHGVDAADLLQAEHYDVSEEFLSKLIR
ncbi:hypothetical protein [Lacrimispora sp.]|uniref:hypothetical protein n=1 Tax=Lacrimispora sp. TaxID=2719234 RepID=UPI0034614247